MPLYYSHLPTNETKQIAAKHWLNHTEVATESYRAFL
jgi:hypothetical protein